MTEDDPTPTTGPPDPWWDERPMDCTCYIREDGEYGDMWTQPVGGCAVHVLADWEQRLATEPGMGDGPFGIVTYQPTPGLPWSDEGHDIKADLRAFAEWARTARPPAFQPLIPSPSRALLVAQWRRELEQANREAKWLKPMRVAYRRRQLARRRAAR